MQLPAGKKALKLIYLLIFFLLVNKHSNEKRPARAFRKLVLFCDPAVRCSCSLFVSLISYAVRDLQSRTSYWSDL
jgi:hypothetical protein